MERKCKLKGKYCVKVILLSHLTKTRKKVIIREFILSIFIKLWNRKMNALKLHQIYGFQKNFAKISQQFQKMSLDIWNKQNILRKKTLKN